VPKFAAFLRGVNLGRNRRVSGAELRSIFEELGFEGVAPFRTSGNVAFAGDQEPHAGLTYRVEAGLSRSLGYEVEVFLRSEAEMQRLAAHQPFDPAVVEASKGKLQVILLSDKPPKRVRDDVLALATPDDRLAMGDREVYWLPSGGTRDSGLDRKAIEKLLGSTTMRTKGTIEQMAAKHFAG
jgi:uncharacterized protein (DUF1697 family)